MPNVNKDDHEIAKDPIAVAVGALAAGGPAFVVGINRRIALPGYEHMDLYGALNVPLELFGEVTTVEGLKEAASEAAKAGFEIVSKEINDRVLAIKKANNDS